MILISLYKINNEFSVKIQWGCANQRYCAFFCNPFVFEDTKVYKVEGSTKTNLKINLEETYKFMAKEAGKKIKTKMEETEQMTIF